MSSSCTFVPAQPTLDGFAPLTVALSITRPPQLSSAIRMAFHGANYVPMDRPNPATNLLNARLSYVLKQLDVSLFVDNVLDRQPLIGTLSYFPSSSIYRIQNSTFRPRTIGIAANYNF